MYNLLQPSDPTLPMAQLHRCGGSWIGLIQLTVFVNSACVTQKKRREDLPEGFFVYFPDESLINGGRSMACKSFKTQVCSHERCNSNCVGGGILFLLWCFDRGGNTETAIH